MLDQKAMYTPVIVKLAGVKRTDTALNIGRLSYALEQVPQQAGVARANPVPNVDPHAVAVEWEGETSGLLQIGWIPWAWCTVCHSSYRKSQPSVEKGMCSACGTALPEKTLRERSKALDLSHS